MVRMRGPSGRQIFIEIVTVGTYAKVSAIDSESGIEVSITGPANADRDSLQSAAVAKLQYVLKKQDPEVR
jgi:hypothetical protein